MNARYETEGLKYLKSHKSDPAKPSSERSCRRCDSCQLAAESTLTYLDLAEFRQFPDARACAVIPAQTSHFIQ